MRKKIIFIILFIFLIFFPLSKNKAREINSTSQPIPTSTLNKDIDILNDLFKILFNYNNPYLKLNQKESTTLNSNLNLNDLVYYPQCQGPYDSYPLPQGGTLCQAGCGPTTVAMITASLINRSINPGTIVEQYKQNGYYLGYNGSRYRDAEKILKSYNLKIAYIFADNRLKTIDQLMNQFGQIIRNYQNSGWTFFALADFCDNGCGHFFWIIKINEDLNTLAYDPYYGRLSTPPYNQKSRYPFPKYRVIFGVKK
mgnify:CR=1 FL=1